jgi:hypothetical protein
VRYPSSVDSSCHPTSRVKEKSWSGKVQDISATGLCLVLERRFEPGTILTAELQGKRRGASSLRIVRVMRISEKTDGKYFLGCAFQRPLSDSELKMLL